MILKVRVWPGDTRGRGDVRGSMLDILLEMLFSSGCLRCGAENSGSHEGSHSEDPEDILRREEPMSLVCG